MTAKQRRRATLSARTQEIESKMCAEANAVHIGSEKFWTKRELELSESEGRYERHMVEQAFAAARRRKDHIDE